MGGAGGALGLLEIVCLRAGLGHGRARGALRPADDLRRPPKWEHVLIGLDLGRMRCIPREEAHKRVEVLVVDARLSPEKVLWVLLRQYCANTTCVGHRGV